MELAWLRGSLAADSTSVDRATGLPKATDDLGTAAIAAVLAGRGPHKKVGEFVVTFCECMVNVW